MASMGNRYPIDVFDDSERRYDGLYESEPGPLSRMFQQALGGSIVVVLLQIISAFWLYSLSARDKVAFQQYNIARASYSTCVAQAAAPGDCQLPQPFSDLMLLALSVVLVAVLGLLVALVTLLWASARSAYVSGRIRHGIFASLLCAAIYESVGFLLAVALISIGGNGFTQPIADSVQLSGGERLLSGAITVASDAVSLLTIGVVIAGIVLTSGCIGALGGLIGKLIFLATRPQPVTPNFDDEPAYAYAYAPPLAQSAAPGARWSWNPSGRGNRADTDHSYPSQASLSDASHGSNGWLPIEEPLPPPSPTAPVLPHYGRPAPGEWGFAPERAPQPRRNAPDHQLRRYWQPAPSEPSDPPDPMQHW